MKKIPLSGKNGRGKFVLVDDEDFVKLQDQSWHVVLSNKGTYLTIRTGQFLKSIAYFILNCPQRKQIDHINGNTLDNRKINLRVCEKKQNAMNLSKRKDNSSGYKGVHFFNKVRNKKHWMARIQVNKERIFLGYFNTPLEAAIVYDQAAKKYHGEFAKLNLL